MLPIHEAALNKDRFVPMVYGAFGLCCVFFTIVGLTGYVARGGPAVNTNLLLSLDQAQPLTAVAQIFYTVDVLLSFPLQAFPAYRIVEALLGMPTAAGKHDPAVKCKKNCLRFCVVLGLAWVAWGASAQLANFVSLLGGLAMCPLAFVFPAALHYNLCATSARQRAIDAVVFVLGVTIVLLCTSIAVWQWATKGAEVPPPCVPVSWDSA